MKNFILVFGLISLLSDCCSSASVKESVQKVLKNSRINQKSKNTEESTITEEERNFVREIERKFNINQPNGAENQEDQPSKIPLKIPQRPLPAVIAIEIVNDNSTDSKGKRTIDANLGYGYKTSNGYFYSHFGKPAEERGKFMIYPYSQEDIPPSRNVGKTYKYHTQIVFNNNKVKGEKTIVEIQPSKAYQLVPINEHENTYNLDGAVSHLKTQYEHIHSVQNPPPLQYPTQPGTTTLYGTFNGGQVSGLSGQFPLVMPNYFVSPSQFLNHYPGVELPSTDVLQKPIIPVIILRIPSSHIQNPTAEIFPKIPHNSPFASALSNINLQSIVHQYLSSIHQQQHFEGPEAKYPIPPPYFEPHHQYYMTGPPNLNHFHYQQPNYPELTKQFPQPQQQVHQAHFQRLYESPKLQHPVYEDSQDDSLPFFENYPDTAHTRVIYTPHFQPTAVNPVVHNAGQIGYVTPQVKEYTLKPLEQPEYVQQGPQPTQNHIEVTGEENQGDITAPEEQPPPSPQPPYNYHAHPYPKRQIKPSDQQQQQQKEEPKKSHTSRRLRSGSKDVA